MLGWWSSISQTSSAFKHALLLHFVDIVYETQERWSYANDPLVLCM